MSKETKEIIALVNINGIKEEKTVYENITVDDAGNESRTFSVQNGFDAMTGEPVYVELTPDGFDAMTGKPVYQEKAHDETQTKQAEEPVYNEGQEVQAEEPVYKAEETEQAAQSEETIVPASETYTEDAYQNPVNVAETGYTNDAYAGDSQPENSKSKLMIIGIVAAVVLVLLGVFAAIKGGLFMSANNKVALATVNTVKEYSIVESMLDASQFLENDELTTKVNGKINAYRVNADVEMTFAQDVSAGKYSADGSASIAGITDQSFNLYYDDERLQFKLPDISDKLFEYNYKAKNKGYLADIIYDETDGSIDDLNTIFKCASDMGKATPKYRKTLDSKLAKAYSKIKVKKIESQEFEVNGKDRKCKGYTVTITDKDLKNIVEASKKAQDSAYGDSMKKLLEAVSNLTGEDYDYDDLMDALDEDLDDIKEYEIDVYIYKNKLAAIKTRDLGMKLSVEFRGGDKRVSEVVIKVDGEKAYLKDKERDDREVITFEADGNKVGKLSYRKSDGKFSIEAGSNEIGGVFFVDKGKKIKLGFDGSYYGASANLEAEIVKGAKISKLKGDVFDLGKASEDDFEDLFDEIGSSVKSAMGGIF